MARTSKQHSPGPWMAHPRNGNTAISCNGWQIGSVIGSDAQGQADAALIAQAPEMLAILKEAVAQTDRYPSKKPENQALYDRARVAIAKATLTQVGG